MSVVEDIAPGRPTIRLADGTEFGLTMKAEEVARIWDLSLWEIYAASKRHDLPVEAIKVGSRILRWPTLPVLRSVGIETTVESGP
jgi:hypothetical protein